MIKPVQIGDYLIGKDQPCFIIAEAGVNHNGDINLAHKLIDSASEAGADAVKFQSFISEDLVTLEAPTAGYQVKTTGESGGQYAMLKALELSAKQQAELKSHCEKVGILYLCTPYEEKSIDMLDKLDVDAYKIASTDTTNTLLLRYIAQKGRPVILSTGMCSLGEVETAMTTLCENGLKDKIVILQCTSEYPTPINEVNLRVIQAMEYAFNCPVGFSDHTSGIGATPWAVALGACIVEKHFTLDRCMKGPDHSASLEPLEFKQLVQTIRNVEVALGDGIKCLMASEINNKPKMQKSLVVKHDIKAGEIVRAEDLTCKRPGTGLSPTWVDMVAGKVAKTNLKSDEILRIESIVW